MQATLDAMLAYAEQVRADHTITDVVNIGIGGSDLGPQMAVLALDEFVAPGKRFHFVSNVDGHELAGVLQGLAPEHTLFLIARRPSPRPRRWRTRSSAKRWFEQSGGVDIARHFAALTTNVEAARAFGIETTFGFWDWVGGRYSLWSAIGLPIALAIGADGFRGLLAGAHAMDEHFRTAPLEQNLPVRLGLLDVWYRNFHRFTSRSIAPYHSALKRVPAYLQQLEMESNGKQVDADGQPLPFGTSPVLWGEPGTNGQHAYFQMLHQGTDVTPLEFIAVRDAVARPRRPPCQAAGQCAGAGAGADGRAARRGRPQELPGQPAEHLLRARQAHARSRSAPFSRCTSTACSPAARCGASTASTSGAWSSARCWRRTSSRGWHRAMRAAWMHRRAGLLERLKPVLNRSKLFATPRYDAPARGIQHRGVVHEFHASGSGLF